MQKPFITSSCSGLEGPEGFSGLLHCADKRRNAAAHKAKAQMPTMAAPPLALPESECWVGAHLHSPESGFFISLFA